MNGTSADTGKSIGGLEHLRQSIADILTTPIGTRVMRRDYGSNLFRLVDAPLNRSTLLQLYAATAEALALWEPRLSVESVRATGGGMGQVTLEITGTYLPSGEAVTMEGIEIGNPAPVDNTPENIVPIDTTFPIFAEA